LLYLTFSDIDCSLLPFFFFSLSLIKFRLFSVSALFSLFIPLVLPGPHSELIPSAPVRGAFTRMPVFVLVSTTINRMHRHGRVFVVGDVHSHLCIIQPHPSRAVSSITCVLRLIGRWSPRIGSTSGLFGVVYVVSCGCGCGDLDMCMLLKTTSKGASRWMSQHLGGVVKDGGIKQYVSCFNTCEAKVWVMITRLNMCQA
jgi:hypothetical protein